MSEGTVPLQSQLSSIVTLPFDNTAGFTMGVALANVASGSASVTATMWDDSGNSLGTQTITIAGSGHTSFDLAESASADGREAGHRAIRKCGWSDRRIGVEIQSIRHIHVTVMRSRR